ncbi:MAG: hypothetical protein A3A86_03770 [Elusimicrobia bacterium RIFCSPLOWO2_01_FULL_60_11]|nr:MAG: hypothetical protein A3A86_03770 [Elusimicrobia bacterium RIFCSPLOWO2_01_FULL_60_11]
MAECSESTGKSRAPYFLAVAVTSSPAMMSDSLLARATVRPIFKAERRAFNPTAPTTPESTRSTFPMVATFSRDSVPPKIFRPVSRGDRSPWRPFFP